MTSITEPAEWLVDLERFHGEWEGGARGADICVIANHIDGPGGGPRLHKHPYPEIFVIRGGRAVHGRRPEDRGRRPARSWSCRPAPHTNSRTSVQARSTRSTFTKTATSSPSGWSDACHAAQAFAPAGPRQSHVRSTPTPSRLHFGRHSRSCHGGRNTAGPPLLDGRERRRLPALRDQHEIWAPARDQPARSSVTSRDLA